MYKVRFPWHFTSFDVKFVSILSRLLHFHVEKTLMIQTYPSTRRVPKLLKRKFVRRVFAFGFSHLHFITICDKIRFSCTSDLSDKTYTCTFYTGSVVRSSAMNSVSTETFQTVIHVIIFIPFMRKVIFPVSSSSRAYRSFIRLSGFPPSAPSLRTFIIRRRCGHPTNN